MRSRVLVMVSVLGGVLHAASSALLADEGMCPIDMLDKLPWAELKAMGLALEPDQIYDGKGHGLAHAVVGLGGGTGSFVSPNGLILTNHHVAFRAIQRASTPEHDYITDGFYAALAEDDPGPRLHRLDPRRHRGRHEEGALRRDRRDERSRAVRRDREARQDRSNHLL